MRARSLRQLNVRNLVTERLIFQDGVTAVVGPNAAGKSNLLGALLLGATGSLPAGTIAESLRFGSEQGYVRLDVETVEGPRVIEVGLEPGRKQVRVDGQGVRTAELGRIGGAVRIAPDDTLLVHGPPARRRAFLDDLLSRTSLRYALMVRAYHRVVDQRNALLREGQGGSLEAWDARFLELGRELQELRARAVAAFAPRAAAAYDQIAGGEARLGVALLPSHPARDLADALEATRALERARGATQVGPHRDELELTMLGRPLAAFGSRGEARTAALALRVAEFEVLEARHGAAPLLLIDDAHAELDPQRRRYLSALAARTPQAIVTGTEPPPRYDRLWSVDKGVIRVEDAEPDAALRADPGVEGVRDGA